MTTGFDLAPFRKKVGRTFFTKTTVPWQFPVSMSLLETKQCVRIYNNVLNSCKQKEEDELRQADKQKERVQRVKVRDKKI